MRLLFASAEVAPFSKTGGLGDVAGALPLALEDKLQSVHVISPLYGDISCDEHSIAKTKLKGRVLLGDTYHKYSIFASSQTQTKTQFMFIENDHFFGRKGIYTTPDGEGFPDNNQRFFFFQLVIRDLLNKELLEVDILHCNDHHTGLLPALLKLDDSKIKTVFTIHNFLYHGHFTSADGELLPLELIDMLHKTQWQNYSALLEGIDHANKVNTVSPGYAEELLQGMDIDVHSFAHILAASHKFSGIVNGIDINTWDPEQDVLLRHHYSVQDLGPKLENKKDLLIQNGLDLDLTAPLFGSVSRLVENKGFPLIVEVIEEFVNQGCRFVFLGSGDPRISKQLRDLSEKHPEQVAFQEGYSESLAHLIEAGADVFLMPSRFEPCGLNQLYSLRYGTVPLVNRTGGLSDTVSEVQGGGGTGFLMDGYKVSELRLAMLRVLDLYKDKQAWLELMQRGMNQDWSWSHSAEQYFNLFQELERG